MIDVCEINNTSKSEEEIKINKKHTLIIKIQNETICPYCEKKKKK